ncbi:TetR/AcrR family transcriptional regulator [Actinomadura alba]|uniref:TetR/AcrR family transcriptional regulator n=1 Tax=Actinomadura alba TaxID=406431 RepID=A0ABR7LH74_9ACTN|nr:TetR/AcrR family transcriptional regulator [Actinomadura alba]MBC6464028.1 TetR/AcrR family transcriptional regulator [Actinomadura alba]
MPKVSAEHLERRRQQILEAARICFIRKGVHETSMQDVFAESGLSAGAVYRYFKSKNDIIVAIMGATGLRLRDFMEEVLHEDPLPPLDDVVYRFAEVIVSWSGEGGVTRLAPQAWALATYDPQFAGRVRDTMGGMRDLWIVYAERLRDAGRLPSDADTDAVGKLLVGLLPGFIIQRAILGETDADTMRRGIRALMEHAPLPVADTR